MPTRPSSTALAASMAFWFAVASLGMLAFAAYVVGFYGTRAWRGDWMAWNTVLPVGYVRGEPFGNTVLASHLVMAVVVTVGGVLQLLPGLRAKAPQFHRWNGRLFMVSCIVASTSGIYLVWVRGTIGDFVQHLATTINGAVILCCVAMAWRHALNRRFDVHRVWAIRLFLVANGVWFFRVGLMLWLLVFQRPLGFDPNTFQGPFLSALGFAQFLLPLAVFELYRRARDHGGARRRFAVAIGLAGLTVATGLGVFGAVAGLWLPRLSS